jgi:hypothetical protein
MRQLSLDEPVGGSDAGARQLAQTFMSVMSLAQGIKDAHPRGQFSGA